MNHDILSFSTSKLDSLLTRGFFQSTNQNLVEINYCNQGISWNNIRRDRDSIRRSRISSHRANRNTPETLEMSAIRSDFLRKRNFDIFFQYYAMYKQIPLVHPHFQLRKNMKFLNSTDLLYIRSFGIEKLNIITLKKAFLILFSSEETEIESKVVCFDSFEETSKGRIWIVCGKMNGSVIVYIIEKSDLQSSIGKSSSPKFSFFRKQITTEDNEKGQIVNNVEFLEAGKLLLTCCNDSYVRIHDMNTFEALVVFKAQDPVNHCALSKDLGLVALVGDFEPVELYDLKTGNHLHTLQGHKDFGFSSQFGDVSNNLGYILATGNQDFSCMLWDVRRISEGESNINKALYQPLYGVIEAIGELKFIERNIVYCENSDYMHVYNIPKNTSQTLEYFANSVGFCYNNFCKRLYLGLTIEDYCGIMAFDKIKNYVMNLNSILY